MEVLTLTDSTSVFIREWGVETGEWGALSTVAA